MNLRYVRSLTLPLVAVLALAACGADPAQAPADPPDPSTTQPEPSPEAEAEPSQAEPSEVTVVHAQGETVVPVSPETVVVFDPGSIVTLEELGIAIAGAPQLNNPPEELAHYADGSIPVVGSLFEPDLEQVDALQPDLIIIGGRSAEAFEELSRIAPTIDLSVDNADLVAGIRERAETLGTIFAAEEEVASRLARIDDAVARVRALAADAGTALIVQTSGGEVTAYGPGSRFGIIHGEFGVAPAVQALDDEATHGDAVSFEFILEAEPDHLFVLDRDAATGGDGDAARQVLDNELVAQTPAWRDDNVHVMPPFAWYIAPSGLRSLEQIVEFVESALS